MTRYKEPAFQDRINAAARARTEALAKLRAKPPIDEAVLAERAAAQAAKDAAAQEKRQAAKLAQEERKASKRAKMEEAAASKKPERTEEERKAERDARYLARKNRTAS
jgi:hypothetical protein